MPVLGNWSGESLPGPSLHGHELAPADAGPGGEDVHHEVDVPPGEQGAPFGEAQGVERGDHVRGGLLGCPGRDPALGAHPAAAAFPPFGWVPVDLPGVDGVAEDRDQQGAGAAGDRPGVRAVPVR